MNRILQVFSDIDLRNGHTGLHEIAKKKKLNLGDLKDGELVVFLNTERNKMKVYASRDVYAYYRAQHGRIQMEMIAEIPKAFQGRTINFNGALKEALLGILGRKARDN